MLPTAASSTPDVGRSNRETCVILVFSFADKKPSTSSVEKPAGLETATRPPDWYSSVNEGSLDSLLLIAVKSSRYSLISAIGPKAAP